MIESLEKYRILVEPDPERYKDNSGLFEILESIYIQLCQSDPWFNAYTEYYYSNVIKTHTIQAYKQLDIEGHSKIFSTLNFDARRGFEIWRRDNIISPDDEDMSGIIVEQDGINSGTFGLMYGCLKDWFSEILIRVKKYNKGIKFRKNEGF